MKPTVKKWLLAWTAASLALPVAAQFSAPKRGYLEYYVSTDHADRNYAVGQQAYVRVEAQQGGVPLGGDVWLHYTVEDEMTGAGRRSDSVRFSHGLAVVPVGTRSEPGFRACQLRFSGYDRTVKDFLKVGYSPERIKSYTPMPADFDRFWTKAVREARRVALEAEVTPLPQRSTEQVEVFLVGLNAGPGYRVYGYLTKPRDGERHPVLFCPPGAGSKKIEPTTFYSERGYVYLNINIHNGLNSELTDSTFNRLRAATEDYWRQGLERPADFYYKKVYAGCVRCVDFLCSLPEWDGRNVGVTGGSQGGALTLVTAALSERVTFCSPFYPALCDLLGFRHQRAGGWPKYFQRGEEVDGAEATLPYYDVVNFARRVSCPVYYSFGYADDTCSAYNEITSEKALDVTPTSGHWRFTESNDHSLEWMRKHWR